MEMQEDTFKFSCPHCGQDISARKELVGSKTTCQECREIIEVPDPESLLEQGSAKITEVILDATTKVHKGVKKGAKKFKKKSNTEENGCGFWAILVIIFILVVYFIGC